VKFLGNVQSNVKKNSVIIIILSGTFTQSRPTKASLIQPILSINRFYFIIPGDRSDKFGKILQPYG